MMSPLKKALLRWLGGVPRHDYDYHLDRLKKAEWERDVYKEISDSVFTYIGTYEVWKAQREYRKMMMDRGRPIVPISKEDMVDKPYTKAQAIDHYLGKLVDTFFMLKPKLGSMHQVNRSPQFKSEEELTRARGDEYVVHLK